MVWDVVLLAGMVLVSSYDVYEVNSVDCSLVRGVLYLLTQINTHVLTSLI